MHAPEYSRREWRLHEWQSALQACIVEPQRDRERIRPHLQAGSVDVDSQLEIYANAYVMRLVEALRSNYPALHHALGDKGFEVMARCYLERYPSTHASIRWFGDSMARFLQDRDPYRQVPVLSELAAFEWAVRHTIDAADTERLSTPPDSRICSCWGSEGCTGPRTSGTRPSSWGARRGGETGLPT